MKYIGAFLLSFIVVILAVPPLQGLALKYDFLDKPTSRKKHKTPVSLVGGLAMLIGFTIAYVLFLLAGDLSFKHIAILLGGVMILAIGLLDDYYKTQGKEFAILPRVLVQFAAAALVFAAGIRFTGFMNPFTDTYVLLPVGLQFFLTIMWIFGVVTVINFSDGLDGLAGIQCSISGITLLIAALLTGQGESAMIAAILIGAIIGFLKYNFHPAQIFMGDSGAYFLGYMLAVISLYGAFKQATVISVVVPVLALGVPIFDNIFVVLKRFVNHTPIYKADSSQAHYRLLKTGMSPVMVVVFLALISVCLNLTSIILMLL